MKKSEKSLQKLTDYSPALQSAIEKVEQYIPITDDDTTAFTDEDFKELSIQLTQRLKAKKGTSRDKFIIAIEGIIGKEMRNQLWEANHSNIQAEISNQMQERNRMPSVKEIAEGTGLSRQTVNKHIKEFNLSGMNEEMERYRFLQSKVLAKVFKFAVTGDIRAAKLYFDVVNGNTKSTSNNTTQNFIQINNVKVEISKLPPEARLQLEEIVKSATLIEETNKNETT